VRELLRDAAETLVERGYGDARIAGLFDRANVNIAQLFSTSAAASS
jgi:AcrR family transcriptional regulator